MMDFSNRRLLSGPTNRSPIHDQDQPRVSRNGDSLTALGFNKLYDFVRIRLLFRKIIDNDVCAFASIGDRSGPADAGVPTRHERFTALQSAETLVAGFAVIRDWLHFPGKARDGLRLLGNFG
jgi:hypothetical protein